MPALDAIERNRVRHRPSIREERAMTVTFDPDRYKDAADPGVDERTTVNPMRGVELNVFAAEPHELVDLLAKDFGDVA